VSLRYAHFCPDDSALIMTSESPPSSDLTPSSSLALVSGSLVQRLSNLDLECVSFNITSPPPNDIKLQLDIFLSEVRAHSEIDPLVWWKTNATRFSQLKTAAIRYLLIPPSSVVQHFWSSFERITKNIVTEECRDVNIYA